MSSRKRPASADFELDLGATPAKKTKSAFDTAIEAKTSRPAAYDEDLAPPKVAKNVNFPNARGAFGGYNACGGYNKRGGLNGGRGYGGRGGRGGYNAAAARWPIPPNHCRTATPMNNNFQALPYPDVPRPPSTQSDASHMSTTDFTRQLPSPRKLTSFPPSTAPSVIDEPTSDGADGPSSNTRSATKQEAKYPPQAMAFLASAINMNNARIAQMQQAQHSYDYEGSSTYGDNYEEESVYGDQDHASPAPAPALAQSTGAAQKLSPAVASFPNPRGLTNAHLIALDHDLTHQYAKTQVAQKANAELLVASVRHEQEISDLLRVFRGRKDDDSYKMASGLEMKLIEAQERRARAEEKAQEFKRTGEMFAEIVGNVREVDGAVGALLGNAKGVVGEGVEEKGSGANEDGDEGLLFAD